MNIDLLQILNPIRNSKSFSIGDYDLSGNLRILDGVEFTNALDKFSQALEGGVLKKGSLIIIPMNSKIECVIILLAALKSGTFPIPIKSSMPKRFIKDLARSLSAAIIIENASMALFEEYEKLNTSLTNYHIALPTEINTIDSIYPYHGNIGILTSGTTNNPKIVVHSINNIINNAKLHATSVRINKSNKIAACLSMSFSYAIVAGLFSSMITESTIILISPSDENINNKITSNHFDTLMCTPFVLNKIISIELISKINKLIVGGDLLQKFIAEKVLYINPKIDFYSTYGLTEAGPRVATSHITKEVLSKYSSIPLGIPLDGINLTDNTQQLDNSGYELMVETPTIMLGYLNAPLETNNIITNNKKIIKTGDLFLKNGMDYFFYGRKNRIICRAGENISPHLIENSILSFFSIREVLVEGKKHHLYGEVPIAYIVINKEVNLDSLNKHLLRIIPRSFIPVEWNIVQELPKKAKI